MVPSDSPFTNECDIKELPHTLDGSFGWLAGTPTHHEWAIGNECAKQTPSQLKAVIASAKSNGLTLPAEFVAFMRTPNLHKHLRSAGGCYLKIAETVLPFGTGFLVRFLHDQQGCAFWYIYVTADGKDHCVVSSYEYFDADEMDYELEDLKETDFHVWATSFEGFLSRFWIENEIMFSESDGTPLPDVDPRFLELYSPL